MEDTNAAAIAETQFNFPDDYKNWQMANLNALVYLEETSRETLDRLRGQDSYWFDVNRPELASMLRVYWRNVGKWRLVAENRDYKRAIQAVNAWRDVVVQKVQLAVNNSEEVLVLDSQLKSNANAQTELTARLAELTQVQQSLQSWREAASQWPTGQPVSEQQRLQLLAPLQATGFPEAWTPILAAFPAQDALPADYLGYLENVTAPLEQEIQQIQAQIDALEQERASLAIHYEDASKKSRGFSANLDVEKISDALPQVTVIRPTARLALVGGLLGLVAWLIVWVAKITLRKRS
jgi:hypothetical protein